MGIKIAELATVMRSKNAGTFRITMDFFFDNIGKYNRVKRSGVITRELISKLYNIPLQDVEGVFFSDVAMGIKITILRPGGIASGDPGCYDIMGCSFHIPLYSIEIP